MTEPEVLIKVHRFLLHDYPFGDTVVRIYTDVHASLLSLPQLAPFLRFTVDLGDLVLHPDLVGQLSDGETLFAVEAKGNTDLIRGLAQAELYQSGFHRTYLAASTHALGRSLVAFARQKNVGIIAVDSSVEIVHQPDARLPLRDVYRFIARQMDSAASVSKGATFAFNLPTHYLLWAIALTPNVLYSLTELADVVRVYPLPQGRNPGQSLRAALAGASKIGIVRVSGNQVYLTDVGATARTIIGSSLEEWAKVHTTIAARGGPSLADIAPRAAAVLRMLLLQDVQVRLVIGGLRMFQARRATFDKLAEACDSLDHASAPIFFLHPRAVATLSDERGRIAWAQATGEDFRATSFQQYKSILRHAGIVTGKLGGTTSKGYDPQRDLWELCVS
jgi:hypothetical protein